MRTPKQFVAILRWIACVPVALAVAFGVQIAIVWLSAVTVLERVNPDSFAVRICMETITNAVFGTVLIFVAAGLAPSRKPAVGGFIVVATLLFLATRLIVRHGYGSGWDYYAAIVTVTSELYAVRALHVDSREQVATHVK